MSERRVRTLTYKAMETYEDRVAAQYHKLTLDIRAVEQIYNVEPAFSVNSSIACLNRARDEMRELYHNVELTYSGFVRYLEDIRTEASLAEISKVDCLFEPCEAAVTKYLDLISQVRFNKLETMSQASASSVYSITTQKKVAEAEAAKAKLLFAEEELRLTKEKINASHKQADIDAELILLRTKREAAALSAEAGTYERLEIDADAVSVGHSERMERVKDFVETHGEPSDTKPPVEPSDTKPPFVPSYTKPPFVPSDTKPPVESSDTKPPFVPSYTKPPFVPSDTKPPVEPSDTKPPFVPSYTKPPVVPPDTKPAVVSPDPVVQYLLRKDLLLSRLSVFSDTPENYQSWKASFKAVASEMAVSPTEEMDLLIKWLGVNSKRNAISLKSAYLTSPEEGLRQIWTRLDERYGSAESVLNVTEKKLNSLSRITRKDPGKLYELSDILAQIQGLMEDPKYQTTLSYYNSAAGINPIIAKLPYDLQQKWVGHATNYKLQREVTFPPFKVFADFIRKFSRVWNDPSFVFDSAAGQPGSGTTKSSQRTSQQTKLSVLSSAKTEVDQSRKVCPIHKSPHGLETCRVFDAKSIEEKRKFVSDNKLCFKCLLAGHAIKDCKQQVECQKCPSKQHHTTMHVQRNGGEKNAGEKNGGERNAGEKSSQRETNNVYSKCTEVCTEQNFGKSCAKIVLVKVYTKDDVDNILSCYAILDEQSNRSLVKPELFRQLNIKGEAFEYSLTSCAGIHMKSGRMASDIVIESINGDVRFELPSLLECPDVPSNRNEIPTPSAAASHPHLLDIASEIPEVDEGSQILLLLGRDIADVHHVLDQRVGPRGSPFAQRLPLGWVIVGEVCLGNQHLPERVTVNKTYIVGEGRASLLPPCPSKFHVDELNGSGNDDNVCANTYVVDNGRFTLYKPCNMSDTCMYTYDSVFATSDRDDLPSLSVEDRAFLSIMDSEFVLDSNGKWTAPLPFKSSRLKLPNNRVQALKRAKSLENSLRKHPTKKQHVIEFMEKLLVKGHAEIAPALSPSQECWYLPMFGVYHPRKPDKIRVVFDSSAQFEGLSLNSVLLQGPNLTNSLLGVLMRFRRDIVAVAADVEQMFYCFGVNEEHRDYLRFLWYQGNDLTKPLIEYRMCKHVFGNSPSPAVATYGLRKAVEGSESDVRDFVNKDFYVDDGLTSCPSAVSAVDLLQRTQRSLASTGLRLHKIVSNDPEVMKSLPREDLASDLSQVDFDHETLPTQGGLGLKWDLNQDSFIFSSEVHSKPTTKRGILSTVNSIFDPLGFLAPVVIDGRLILRDVVASGADWDSPLHPDVETRWTNWLDKVGDLDCVRIQRSLFKVSITEMSKFELHIFSDASEKAIAAVVYLVAVSSGGGKQVSFVLGKVKVAPSNCHTIPRLELCGAVLATELYQIVVENLDVEISRTRFYTDSRVVLGYICNHTRRFYTYVSNRVHRIRHVSSPMQWQHVPTDKNPADVGTRGASPPVLVDSLWLSGPSFLSTQETPTPEFFPLIEPNLDAEVRADVTTMSTKVTVCGALNSERFERFSCWDKLVLALSVLIHIAMSFRKQSDCSGFHTCVQSNSVQNNEKAERLVIKEAQAASFPKDVSTLQAKGQLDRSSPLLSLNPFLDEFGLLRVGGRLSRSNLPIEEKHPVILSAKHHVAKLIIRRFHESVHHQGRLLTEGAIRRAGYWIIGGKRAITSYIFHCVPCKKLRGQAETQKMSDLPLDRTEQSTPFSQIGVDVFGPWQVVSRKTRGSQASAKRWAVLFTCLCLRAVHIEVIDEMSSSAFVNALRRLVAIRGKVRLIRSDRGTNFVGATDLIGAEAINVEDEKTTTYLRRSGCVWLFNAPHSSHMGGVWERMIGLTRRILESVLSGIQNLTHDVLVTFMAEVGAIINARPIVPVSSDPDCPEVLSPSALLNLKLDLDQQPVGDLSFKDMYRDQWKRVKYLTDQFWSKWRSQFLQSLQERPKWHHDQTPVKVNDVVLLKDRDVSRNCWPLGRVSRIFPSADSRVRKVEVCITREGKQTFLVRPVVEMVVLVRY